ncbi:Uncharacterised protein [Serratia quinivorans]|uniref:hypothetical protein n=1 Tax=Serratia quinivorans TaxID=137545 RepID=UPI0021773B6D|nr:hypothetical protein [Serratia quinivorans]CAI0767682.1 Uncharacterised protein [Serratia quinivorans]CAI0852244.1 Uncharacterised protein [Serratia quinivorans]CAI0898253.1 Uncharacterised protein [Serratia quinivorans]CAI1595476.1 Uncharacterised protein [Serratia quinivorans]CAI1994495.1 Uncharacterised protein [Serratia quinivorans]
MRIVKEGDTRSVLCQNCGRTMATYRLRDVDFSDRCGTVRNILAAVCNQCNAVVSVPAQSTPRIKSEFEQAKSALEVRVPAHYLDILNVATQKIDDSLDENFHKTLILYYLHALTTGRYQQQELKTLLGSELANAKSSKRLSMKVSQKQLAELNSIMEQQSLTRNSDVVKAVILKIYQDLVQEKNLGILPELRNVAAALS